MSIEIFRYQSFGIEVETRDDGMWNLTALCKPFNRQPIDFLKTKEGKAFASALEIWLQSPNVNNPQTEDSGYGVKSTVSSDLVVNKVFEVRKGGADLSKTGTWGHRLLALRMAMWLDPMFAIWVVSVSDRLITKGYVSLSEELDRLSKLTDEMSQNLAITTYERDKYRHELAWRESEDTNTIFSYTDLDEEMG